MIGLRRTQRDGYRFRPFMNTKLAIVDKLVYVDFDGFTMLTIQPGRYGFDSILFSQMVKKKQICFVHSDSKSRCKLWFFNKLSKHWVTLLRRTLTDISIHWILFGSDFSYKSVHLSFKNLWYTFLRPLFCVAFIRIILFLYCHCRMAISTRATVYHCSKCCLVELLRNWHTKCEAQEMQWNRIWIHNTYKSITFSELN